MVHHGPMSRRSKASAVATWQQGDYAFIGSQAVGHGMPFGGEKTVLMNWGTRSLGVISVQVSTIKQQVDQEHMKACIQCW